MHCFFCSLSLRLLFCLCSVVLLGLSVVSSAFQQCINQLWSCLVLGEQLFGIKLNLVWAELHTCRFITDVFVHSINGEWWGAARFEAISTVSFTGRFMKCLRKWCHLCMFYNKLKNVASEKKADTLTTRIYVSELNFMLFVYNKFTCICFLLLALWLCHSDWTL